MAIFEGAGVALATPMKANGEINYDTMAKLIGRVRTYFCCSRYLRRIKRCNNIIALFIGL